MSRGLSGAQHVRVALVDAGRVEVLGGGAVAPLTVRAHSHPVPFAPYLCDVRRKWSTVPVLVRTTDKIAGVDRGGVGDAVRDPGSVLDQVGRELVVGDIQEEAVRPLDTSPDQAICRIADTEPG